MNAPLDIIMDKATFLRWAQHREGRWELVGGRPVMQQNPTRVHGNIARNLERVLIKRLDPARWDVRRGDISVDLGAETRLPDLLVEPAGLPLDGLTTTAPVLIAEVLSPSSMTTDFRDKPTQYFKLPTLEAYVVLSQTEPYAWVWQRTIDGDRRFPDAPQEIDDPNETLVLAHLGQSVPLAEIYDGIAWS